MNNVHPLIRVGGPILGVLILFYVVNTGVNEFQANLKASRDAERAATLAASQTEDEPAAEADEAQTEDEPTTEADETQTEDEPAAETDETQTEDEPTTEADEAQTEDEPAAEADETQTEDEPAAEADEEPVAQRVFFRQPTNNAIIPPTSVVKMGAEGLVVQPSGEVNPGAGHMHILVDTDFVPAGEVIINDEQHLHFGDGSIEAELMLPPGAHTLRLQFADGAHIALEGEQFQDEITVLVEENAASPSVRFVQPTDGETVSSPLKVVMAATGLVVEPSGEIHQEAGHFHILVDTDFVPAGEVIINDEQHLHFGDGSIEAELMLPPGAHTLRLQFADGAHIALEGEQFQDEITVLVEENAASPSVRFVQPTDGETVSSPLKVVMAATGLVVEPSGEIHQEAGHFHILVDTDFVPAGEVIINDEQHLHFGGGQLTTSLDLAEGEHILRLQFADGAHITLEGDAYQDMIGITVTDSASNLPQETVDLAINAMLNTGCNACHITPGLPEAASNLGPDQTNMGVVAGSRIEGYTAEEYIRESILMPSAFIVPECPTGPCLPIMPENLGTLLTEEELDAVVAYLLTLRSDQ